MKHVHERSNVNVEMEKKFASGSEFRQIERVFKMKIKSSNATAVQKKKRCSIVFLFGKKNKNEVTWLGSEYQFGIRWTSKNENTGDRITQNASSKSDSSFNIWMIDVFG